jgi:predicted alpha/beta-fold hydrolase
VRLRGLLHETPGADALVLVLHGLTGSAESKYCALAARAATAAGLSSLRLSLRGADRSGEDITHAGLTDDVWAALASPEIARYRAVHILGYSAGGHIALRAAAARRDPRLRAVAAVCPPLDLAEASRALDAPARRLYKRHLFAGLDAIYEATAARRRLPVPAARVRRARSLRERDELTVVPRFGFASVADYYEHESARSWLDRLEIPTLVVASRADPIIPAASLERALARAGRALTLRWAPGGHVHFPAGLDLGFGGPTGLEGQVVRWLAQSRCGEG